MVNFVYKPFIFRFETKSMNCYFQIFYIHDTSSIWIE